MISENDVLTKLQSYLDYSIQQKPEYESEYTELMSPLISAVQTYFTTIPNGIENVIALYVHEAYCVIWNQNAKWEKEYDSGSVSSEPAGVTDFRKNYYAFDWMETTAESFFAAWVMGTPDEGGGSEGGGTAKPVSNSLIDAWTHEIEAAPNQDLAKVTACKDWCASGNGSGMLISLLEDQGKLESYKDREEIANEIYIVRSLLEVIQAKGYNVYIPSYLRTSATWAKG